jgi:tetratricopeptide (TPR) repeat protein
VKTPSRLAPFCFTLLLALPGILVSDAAGAERRAGKNSGTPRVGIDTTFGELVRQGRIALQRKKYDEAIAKLTAALEMKPDPKNAALAYSRRAEAFVWTNNLAKAQQDAEVSIRLAPSFADGHFERGLVYRMKEDNDRAIDEFTTAIRLNPSIVPAYNNRGAAYASIFQIESAMRDFNEALRRDPNHAAAYLNRGTAYAALGQRDKALADYDEAIRKNPEMETAYYNRSVLLAALGDHTRALGDLNEATRRNPRSSRMRLGRANAYWKLNKTDLALADYRAAAGLAPPDAKERMHRGLAFFYLGDYRSAAADFALAKQQLPLSSYVLGASAWFKATCPDAVFRNGAEALQESKKACELTNWRDPDQLDAYAGACAEVGNYEGALKYQTEAIKVRGVSADTEMEEHLHCYQQHRPYREEPKSSR